MIGLWWCRIFVIGSQKRWSLVCLKWGNVCYCFKEREGKKERGKEMIQKTLSFSQRTSSRSLLLFIWSCLTLCECSCWWIWLGARDGATNRKMQSKTMQEDSSHPKEKESFKPASNQIRQGSHHHHHHTNVSFPFLCWHHLGKGLKKWGQQRKDGSRKKRKPDYLIGGWLERFPLLSLFCFSETLSKKQYEKPTFYYSILIVWWMKRKPFFFENISRWWQDDQSMRSHRFSPPTSFPLFSSTKRSWKRLVCLSLLLLKKKNARKVILSVLMMYCWKTNP